MRPVGFTRIRESDKREMVWVNPDRIAYVAPAWEKTSYVILEGNLSLHVDHSPEQVLRRLEDNRNPLRAEERDGVHS